MRRVVGPKTEEKIIEADEISEYQEQGWKQKGELSNGRVIVEREIDLEEEDKKDPRKFFR